MGKDPAILFYTSDFLTGTILMSNEQLGKYMRLLCLQKEIYPEHIPENHMISVCSPNDSIVIKKFITDDNGNYYNKRMEIEIEKRLKYCESRSNNKSGRKKNKSYDKSCDFHMNTHMGNENENRNRIKDINKNENENENTPKEASSRIFKKPTLQDVKEYCQERKNNIDPQAFLDHYDSVNWFRGKTKISDWKACVRTWEKNQKGDSLKTPAAQYGPKEVSKEYLDEIMNMELEP